MMRKLLLIFISIFCLTAIGQKITPSDGAVSFSYTKNDSTQTADYESCWGYPVLKKGTDTVEQIKAITYPLPVKRTGLWGAIDNKGNKVKDFVHVNPMLYTDSGRVELIHFDYKNFEWKPTEKSYLSVQNEEGVEKEKLYVQDVYKGTFLVSRDKKNWGLVDSKLKVLLDFEYIGSHHEEGVQFYFSENGYLTLRKNEAGSSFGAVDYKGKTIIPFKWKLISYVITDEEHIYVMNEYLKRGYINIHGQTTLPFIYERIPRELTDSNWVETKDYIYVLDRNLKQIGPKYQSFELKGNIYFFKRDGKWGIMDINRNVIIPHQYSSIMDGPRIKEDPDFKCYIVVKNGLYGLITTDGKEIIKPGYECLCGLGYYAPSDYYIEFKKAEVSYKFDKDGKLIEKGGKSGGSCFCE